MLSPSSFYSYKLAYLPSYWWLIYLGSTKGFDVSTYGKGLCSCRCYWVCGY